ncbi:MAG: hypothetical protein HKN23_00370 [Verrucomicrobiales bacterium]|nr:hypothetical protein [Verrucomicrobiales bacterium]
MTAQDLTPDQMATLHQRLESLKKSLNEHLSTRNTSAGDIFMAASSDPKKAIELYVNCYKIVKFDRENRPDSDFRAWRDSQKNRFDDDRFQESLMILLRYMAFSCKAAELEEFDQVFQPLMEYVDGLSRMEEMPDGILMQSAARTIFAQAYHLEKLIGDNDNWEPVAYNIEGIYDRSILPYLRRKKPEALENAWDRRIEQQTRLVAFLAEQDKKQMKGADRDDERRIRDRQESRGGILGAHDQETFALITLPTLHWSKLKDLYVNVNQQANAIAMLKFLEENLKHPKAEEWFGEFEEMIGGTEGSLERQYENTSPAPGSTPDVSENSAPAPVPAGASKSTKGKSKEQLGLVPAP